MTRSGMAFSSFSPNTGSGTRFSPRRPHTAELGTGTTAGGGGGGGGGRTTSASHHVPITRGQMAPSSTAATGFGMYESAYNNNNTSKQSRPTTASNDVAISRLHRSSTLATSTGDGTGIANGNNTSTQMVRASRTNRK